MRWTAQAVTLMLVFGTGGRQASAALPHAAMHLVAHPKPWLAQSLGSHAPLSSHTPMMGDTDRLVSMPLCPTCLGPWQVAMQMGMADETPLLALRAFRSLGPNGMDPHAANQPLGAWQLGLQAHTLDQPGERRYVAAICRVHKASSVEAGVEVLDAELAPVQDQPRLARRFVRRSGAVLSWQMHSVGAGRKVDPALTWSGLRMGGTMRLWQSLGARPVVDSQVNLQIATPTTQAQRTQLWGHLGWRGLLGSDDKLVRAGGWRMPVPAGENRHVLHEDVPGYEDLTRYTARMMRAQVGIGAALAHQTRVDLFAAATQLDTMVHHRGRWLRAIGANVNVHRLGRSAGNASVSYQVSHRLDGNRGPWLHMLTASI